MAQCLEFFGSNLVAHTTVNLSCMKKCFEAKCTASISSNSLRLSQYKAPAFHSYPSVFDNCFADNLAPAKPSVPREYSGIVCGGVPPGNPNPHPISEQKEPFSTPIFIPGL